MVKLVKVICQLVILCYSTSLFAETMYRLEKTTGFATETEINQYLQLVDKALIATDNHGRAFSWEYANYLMGLGRLYQATGDLRLLKVMVERVGFILARRNDRHEQLVLYVDQKVLPVWPSLFKKWTIGNKPIAFTNLLMTANILQPIAYVSWLILKEPELYQLTDSDEVSYEVLAKQFLRDSTETVNSFALSPLWFDREKSLFRHANSPAIALVNEVGEEKVGQYVAHNRALTMSSVMHYIALANEAAEQNPNTITSYRKIINSQLAYFQQYTQRKKGSTKKQPLPTLFWHFDEIAAAGLKPDDILHGGLVSSALSIISNGNNNSYHLDSSLLPLMANTYLYKLRQSEPNMHQQFNRYIDGTGTELTESQNLSNLGWCNLGLVEQKVWDLSCGPQLIDKGVSLKFGAYYAVGLAVRHELALRAEKQRVKARVVKHSLTSIKVNKLSVL